MSADTGEMIVYRHRVYDCVIDSDIDLSLPIPSAQSPADVILRQASGAYDVGWDPAPGSVLSLHRDDALNQTSLSARTREGYRLRFVDNCEFDIDHTLSVITWRIAPNVDSSLVPIVAAGALMAFRFMLAGDLVLHCSAVSVDGKGLAFVGRSGMGKSTMAALMCSVGAALITDDVGRVVLGGGGVHLAVGGRESRLRGSASHLADLFPASSVRRTDDDRLAVALRASRLGSAPLDAIVVPMPVREPRDLEVRAMSAGEAVIALSAFPRLPGLVDTAMAGRSFHQIVDLAKRVPMFAAAIPWNASLSPRTAAGLVGALGWKLPGTCPAAARQSA